ncbi:MAG: type II toxin-antitoxin system prevent-host-death family antitoxin [Coxiella sp. (in: Bacteria)]|nr:MAG: type II toxin-antitoxin system prevent-host-death family antitoxin [Coxiella sp. (in: g-proteobacteria)]
MLKMTTVEARENFSDLINKAAYGNERVVLTRRGKALAAVIPLADLDSLQAVVDATTGSTDLV